MENVTAYSFGVAAKRQAGELINNGLLMVTYELNHDNVTIGYGPNYNSTHVFSNVYVMRPKTKFTVRLSVCHGYACTVFPNSQTVWTKPAG